MLQISPTVYINPFMLDAVLSKQGEDTLYTMTEGILHREGPTTAQLAANGFLQFGDLWINKLRIARIITATDTIYTSSGYLFKCPGANWSAVASQLSYKETTVYGYEVPGLQYVIANELPSNISGLPLELTGGTGEGGEMQFLGYYPTDLPMITTNSWDTIDQTLDYTPPTFYSTTSYTENVISGNLGIILPTPSPNYFSYIVVHETNLAPTAVLSSILQNNLPDSAVVILGYDNNTILMQGSNQQVSPTALSTFSWVDGIAYANGSATPYQLPSDAVSITAVHIAMSNVPLPTYTFSASSITKFSSPATNGYYIADSNNTYNSRTILQGEALLFTDVGDVIVIQDFTSRAENASFSVLRTFIDSGSYILGIADTIMPSTPGWYIAANTIDGIIAPGRLIHVTSTGHETTDCPIGLRATLFNGSVEHSIIRTYTEYNDGTLPLNPPGWSYMSRNTLPTVPSYDTTAASVYVDRGSVHIYNSISGPAVLTFIKETDHEDNKTTYAGSIFILGKNNVLADITFTNAENKCKPSAVSGDGNVLILNYVYTQATGFMIVDSKLLLSTAYTSVDKTHLGTLYIHPQGNSINLLNATSIAGDFVLFLQHSNEQVPRLLSFKILEDILGDLRITMDTPTGLSEVIFTAPSVGSTCNILIDGGIRKL